MSYFIIFNCRSACNQISLLWRVRYKPDPDPTCRLHPGPDKTPGTGSTTLLVQTPYFRILQILKRPFIYNVHIREAAKSIFFWWPGH